jgi:vacuolar-type H+-ATPase subunit I/STV1
VSSETTSSTGPRRTRRPPAWLNGYTVFAVAITFVLGLWHVLVGITAVMREGLFAAPPGYVYAFDVALWGWILIVLGVLLLAATIVVVLGREGGDTAAIWLACLGMVANFLVCRSTRSGL